MMHSSDAIWQYRLYVARIANRLSTPWPAKIDVAQAIAERLLW